MKVTSFSRCSFSSSSLTNLFLISVIVFKYAEGGKYHLNPIILSEETYFNDVSVIDDHLLNILNNKTLINDLFDTRKTDSVEFPKKIQFKYFKNGVSVYNSTGDNYESLEETGCKSTEKFSFILHGWRQDCNFEWIQLLTEKLKIHRGGCVICIDYSHYSNESYFRLMRNLRPITDTIVNKLNHLSTQGFNASENGYMMGFSFGGQLASAIGRSYGLKKFRNIDTCDMAGPGFDYKGIIDHRNAAQNVHCLHTTRDRGTRMYNCHQNIRLGNCGHSQPAAKDPMFTSHGICVFMYINAFEHPFYVVQKPAKCTSLNPAKTWPDKYKMGYNEDIHNLPSGELFVLTSAKYPYNVLNPEQMDIDEEIPEIGPTATKPDLKPIISDYRFGRNLKQKLLTPFIKAKQFLVSFRFGF